MPRRGETVVVLLGDAERRVRGVVRHVWPDGSAKVYVEEELDTFDVAAWRVRPLLELISDRSGEASR